MSGSQTAGEGGSGDGVEGGDDQDDSSSSSTASCFSPALQDCRALAEFRKEWKREIECSPLHNNKYSHNSNVFDPQLPHSVEDKAKYFFQLGVENEESGKLYEAIQYYRRAVQLVPDIEYRLFQVPTQNTPDRDESDEDVDEPYIVEDDAGDGEDTEVQFDPDQMDLLSHLLYNFRKKRSICSVLQPSNATHISVLPMEIFLYILRWVVSCDLDLRSLEMCAGVCRGFYICCRDQEIWRMACTRIWGVKCGSLGGCYLSWRDMYIHRPRLQFGGCYISKTTYIRHGENSFQDQFYRPWHLVIYYRYLRFFPDGRVHMLTTPEEPVGCVGLLKHRYPQVRRPPVFTGFYRLVDTIVSVVLHPGPDKKPSRPNTNHSVSHTFHLELEIVPNKRSPHGQLAWRGYSIFTRRNGIETNTPFDLINSKYPPFWYSRVKSYTAETFNPLSLTSN